MRVKILLFNLCLWMTALVYAQNESGLSGRFILIDSLQTPSGITFGPAQYARFADALICGVTIDQADTVRTGIFLLPLNEPNAVSTELKIPSMGSNTSYLQGSSSADGSILVFTVNHYNGWTGNDLAMCTRLDDGSYSYPVLLSGINKKDTADCYPWIADDGRRLYYLQDERLMVAEWNASEKSFTTATPVLYTGTVELNILSVWLDSKEKHMWLVSDNKIYRASRKNRKKPFSMPELYTDEFADWSFISGISFTPDEQDMYLYYADEFSNLLHFKPR